MRFVILKNAAPKFKQNLAGLGDRFQAALTAAANMAASMIEEAGRVDIANAGKFGARWTGGLHVRVEGSLKNMRISMIHDIPFADIFETGGTIHGHPFLWIGLSGTNAEGVPPSQYSGGLFSAKYPRQTGAPLLFSINDKLPKYFGIESVTIPEKFHLNEIMQSVMGNFRKVFDEQFRGGTR